MPMNDQVSRSTGTVPARLGSLDALRGFDMLWIMGGDSIGHALAQLHAGGLLGLLALQLNHVDWEGFRFYDLIFPLFIFMVGVSLVFSLSRQVTGAGRSGAIRKIVQRSVILYLLGIIYYGGISESVDQIRLLGVLQRIAICYLFAGLLFCFFKTRGIAIACGILLVGYWAMMTFVPVPGGEAGNFAEGKNLANWFDSQYLPLRKWDGTHDPEGILSTIPAIGSCLFGVLAGILLYHNGISGYKKIGILIGGGALTLALGYAWSLQFPIIKKLWTSSYVLVAAGYSAFFLALFYWLIDVMGFRKWAIPFIWIGMNAILIYMLGNVLSFDDLAARFIGGPVRTSIDAAFMDGMGDVCISVLGMVFAVCVCGFLYRKKIFIKV